MSTSLLKSISLFTPRIWQQTVRHRGKFNIKMPRPRHDIARYLEVITKPVIVLPEPVTADDCVKDRNRIARALKVNTREAIEFERFLASYALDLMTKNAVMLICHKLDVPGEIYRRNKVDFKRLNAIPWSFNRLIMNLVIDHNPQYQNLMPIVENALGKNLYIFFAEENLKKILALLRRTPHLNLFGGMINQKLYTRAGVQEYANMGDLESERSQLVALLNSQLALIPSTLTAPMEQLSMSLGQLAKGETTSLASSNDSPKN